MSTSRIFFIAALALLGAACSQLEEPTVSWYLSVVRGDIEQVERHIHWDTDINAPFPSGRYPLHEAAAKGRIILLKILLDNGADTSVTDAAGRTPIELAILEGRTEAADVLGKAGATFDPSAMVLLIAQRGTEDRDVVKFLKRHGADMNATDEKGNTALMLAVIRNNHRLVHHLVEYGANVNAVNAAGETPLLLAEQVGATELIQFLQRNGAAKRPVVRQQ